MGNSYSSNDKDVFKSLIGKIDGVPIWPPVKDVNLLDGIVIDKNGSVNDLSGICKAYNLEGLSADSKKILKDLVANPKKTEKVSYDLSSSKASSNSVSGETHSLLMHAFSVKGNFNHKNGCSVSIKDAHVDEIGKVGEENGVSFLISQLSGKARMEKYFGRHEKTIYIVTEITKAKAFTVESLTGNETLANFEIVGEKGEVKHEQLQGMVFDAQDPVTPVTIAFKAVRFNVSSKGMLEKPKIISGGNDRGTDTDQCKCIEDFDEGTNNSESNVFTNVDTNRNRLALLIGNNEYDDTSIKNLGGTHNDIELLSSTFENHGISCDTNKDMTFIDTLKKMNDYVTNDKLKKDDIFIFVYAGHGSSWTSEKHGVENTICPKDTYHSGDGVNRDISRNVIQAWMRRLEDKGVNVFFISDSCHSGGLIRGEDDDDDDSELIRCCDDDDRNRSRVSLPEEYDWLDKVRNGETISPVFEKVVWLSACRSYEKAKEDTYCCKQHGVLSAALHSVLFKDNGYEFSFQQIVEEVQDKIQNYFHTKDQQPEVSGNVHTVSLCFESLMKVSPHSYTLVQMEDDKKMQFRSTFLLPLITEKSQYHLYEISDKDMKTKMLTIKIDKYDNSVQNDAHYSVIKSHSGKWGKKKLYRAVEVHHEKGNLKHYLKVYVCNDEEDLKLKCLVKKLDCLKEDMFTNRKRYPVKQLPPTAFIILSDKENYDVKINHNDGFLTVKDRQDELICPKVKLEEKFSVNLLASYIASYAHYQMVQMCSSTKNMELQFIRDDWEKRDKKKNSLKLVMKCEDGNEEYNREIEPDITNEEGYEFNLEYVDNEGQPGSEDFQLYLNTDLKCPFYLYCVYFDPGLKVEQKTDVSIHKLGSGEQRNLQLFQDPYYVDFNGIVKNIDHGKWCNPFFEFQLFLCSEKLEDGMKGVESEGITEPDYTYTEGGKCTEESRDAGPRKSKKKKVEWRRISIKIRMKELTDKYARSE